MAGIARASMNLTKTTHSLECPSSDQLKIVNMFIRISSLEGVVGNPLLILLPSFSG